MPICIHGRLGTATGYPWEKLAELPVKQGIGIAAYLGEALLAIAAEHTVRCSPSALDCKEGSKTHPKNMLILCVGPEGCSGLKVGPSSVLTAGYWELLYHRSI